MPSKNLSNIAPAADKPLQSLSQRQRDIAERYAQGLTYCYFSNYFATDLADYFCSGRQRFLALLSLVKLLGAGTECGKQSRA